MRSSLTFSCVLHLALHLTLPIWADLRPFSHDLDYDRGKWGNVISQRYLSHPEIVGPVANVLTTASDQVSDERHVTWAPVMNHEPAFRGSSPNLLDARTTSLVWAGPNNGKSVIGFGMQSCNGTDYIVWIEGLNVLLYDARYELRYNLTAAQNASDPYTGRGLDTHEIYLTPTCTLLSNSFVHRPHDDMSYIGLGEGLITAANIQEMDIATGQLLSEWHSTDHIALEESIRSKPDGDEGKLYGFDYVHLNSIQKDKKGNLLVSARATSAIYYISGQDGSILWRLGGKRNQFADLSDGQATNFEFQHHARWTDDDLTTLSLFDNHYMNKPDPEDSKSRAMIVQLDYDTMSAKLLHSYPAGKKMDSYRMGSTQVLPNGNVILGYGCVPVWTEYSVNGRVLQQVALGPREIVENSTPDNYRTLKLDWKASPMTNPRIASGPAPVYRFNGVDSVFSVGMTDQYGVSLPHDTLYMSWNGATEVAYWVILASNSTPDLRLPDHYRGEALKGGFEDNFAFDDAGVAYAAAIAVDRDDNLLGMTDVIAVPTQNITRAGTQDLAGLTVAWRSFLAATAPSHRRIRRRSPQGRLECDIDDEEPNGGGGTGRRERWQDFSWLPPFLLGCAVSAPLVFLVYRLSRRAPFTHWGRRYGFRIASVWNIGGGGGGGGGGGCDRLACSRRGKGVRQA